MKFKTSFTYHVPFMVLLLILAWFASDTETWAAMAWLGMAMIANGLLYIGFWVAQMREEK